MPIYEYECQKCGEVFEVMQKYTDPPPKTHKECGSRRVKRIMSRSSFILKGTGWYVTDYARKSNSSDKSDSKSNSSDKSESKSIKAAKSENMGAKDTNDSKKGSVKAASNKSAA